MRPVLCESCCFSTQCSDQYGARTQVVVASCFFKSITTQRLFTKSYILVYYLGVLTFFLTTLLSSCFTHVELYRHFTRMVDKMFLNIFRMDKHQFDFESIRTCVAGTSYIEGIDQC